MFGLLIEFPWLYHEATLLPSQYKYYAGLLRNVPLTCEHFQVQATLQFPEGESVQVHKARCFTHVVFNLCRSGQLYNLPSLIDRRAAGFGYGKRELIFPNSHRDAPSPTAYTINGDTECDRLSNRGLTMSRKLNSDSHLKKSR